MTITQLLGKMCTGITQFFKKMWAWVKSLSRQWLFFAIVLLVWITYTSLSNIALNRKIVALESKSAEITKNLTENREKTANLERTVTESVEKLKSLQKNNDKKVVQARNDASKKISALSDTDITNSWNDFVSAVNKRNSGRNNN